MAIISMTDLTELVEKVQSLTMEVKELRNTISLPVIFNNQSIKQLLNIQDKVLKKYRDDGLLGYRRVGDKYWYTQEDVVAFLSLCHVPAWHSVA